MMGLFDRLMGPNIDKLLARGDRDRLTEALAHPRPELRMRAVQALGELGDPAAAEALIGILGDSEAAVAAAAETVLGGFGDAVNDALGAALEGETRVAEKCRELLVDRDPPALSALVEVVKSGGDQARDLAAGALVGVLGEIADADSQEVVFRALLAALGDRRPAVRVRVARGLGTLADSRAAKALAAQLKDGLEEVRDACSESLEALGEPAIPWLIDTLADRNPNARAAAARLLGRLAAESDREMRERVGERLRLASEDRDAEVRRLALEALGRLE
jgi:HEAT repeat protein